MSATIRRCPNCGSVSLRTIRPDEYQCESCGANFYFTRQDVQKHDTVSHNCPICGKPVQAGQSFRCVRCGKFDVCSDCVSRVEPEGYICKECTRKAGQDCFLCGKFAGTVCKSCDELHNRGQAELVTKVCLDHFSMLFIDEAEIVPSRRGMPPRWGSVIYRCPVHGEICTNCAEEKKRMFGGKKLLCKACGSELQLVEVERSLYP